MKLKRTNVEIDEPIIQEAIKYADRKSKKGAIDQALREFVENHRRLDIRELFGKVHIDPDYDHKMLRISKDMSKSVSKNQVLKPNVSD